MARQRFDIASKWLLHTQGKGALRVGGLKGVQRIEPMPGEIAQSRRWPDSLLRVFFQGAPKPEYVLVEVATYAEKRALKQALNDLTQAYAALGELPDLLMLILRPKGKLRIEGKYEVRGKLGLSRLTAEWKPVELWTLPAAQFLAEVGAAAVPWITLMDYQGPPEALLERCAEKIEREAHPKDQADLLAVSQVLSELRFPQPELLSLLKGKQAMIKSPLLEKMRAETIQELTLDALKSRFGTVPRDVTKRLREIIDETKQRQLNHAAIACQDMDAFREALFA